MSETVFVDGFGESFARAGMSEGLQAQIAAQEEREAREIAQEERQRQQIAEEHQARAVEAAIVDAVERGEAIDMPRALRGEQLGHTPAEFVALISARQDHEDMLREARQRKAFERYQAAQFAATTLDSTAPTALQLEEGHQTKARAEAARDRHYEARAKVHQRWQIIESARRLAGIDAAEAHRRGDYR